MLKKNKRNLTREGRERGRASNVSDPLHGSDSVSSCFVLVIFIDGGGGGESKHLFKKAEKLFLN